MGGRGGGSEVEMQNVRVLRYLPNFKTHGSGGIHNFQVIKAKYNKQCGCPKDRRIKTEPNKRVVKNIIVHHSVVLF